MSYLNKAYLCISIRNDHLVHVMSNYCRDQVTTHLNRYPMLVESSSFDC